MRYLKQAHWMASVALAGFCAAASAGSVSDIAARQGELAVGMDYVVPPFKAGSKVRTPAAIDTALTEDLASRLHVRARAVANGPHATDPMLRSDEADLALVMAAPAAAVASATTVLIPTGYAAAPMAIMRDDTDIKSWEQLKGRTVCVSEGGHYVGTIAARYGAIEKVFKAPADALLALRTGGCDATVHDDTMLKALLKFPEWKKFSASLRSSGPRASLAFIVPADDPSGVALLKDITAQWRTAGYIKTLTQARVRDIAFEVYLDQNIPDCH